MLRSERRYCTEQQSPRHSTHQWNPSLRYQLGVAVVVVWKMDQTLKSPYK